MFDHDSDNPLIQTATILMGLAMVCIGITMAGAAVKILTEEKGQPRFPGAKKTFETLNGLYGKKEDDAIDVPFEVKGERLN